MSKDTDFKLQLSQNKDGKSILSKERATTLKLVVSNPPPAQKISAPSLHIPSNAGFAVEVQKRGADLYEMNIRDPFHELGCDLILDIEESNGESTVVCHFPLILNEANRFLDEDETLYGTIMLRFQMRVLEQLFMFSINHNASQLTIYMDDAEAEGFGIYDDFLSHYDETLMENGEQTEMVIATDQETFDRWLGFMAEMNLRFEQDLWRGQRTNPAIRDYLKSRSLG
jgi:hypothetical protein